MSGVSALIKHTLELPSPFQLVRTQQELVRLQPEKGPSPGPAGTRSWTFSLAELGNLHPYWL